MMLELIYDQPCKYFFQKKIIKDQPFKFYVTNFTKKN